MTRSGNIMTQFSWERRIQRAQQLAGEETPTQQILTFYVEILKWQQSFFTHLAATAQKHPLTGAFERDRGALLAHFGSLLQLVSWKGSDVLAFEASQLNASQAGWIESLASWWNGESEPA